MRCPVDRRVSFALKFCHGNPKQSVSDTIVRIRHRSLETTMSNSGSTRILGPKALEMIMRDVLGGMEELVLMKGYQPGSDVVEIIAIEPPAEAKTDRNGANSRVVNFAHARRRRAS